MSDDRDFLDSNVLLYMVEKHPAKAATARGLAARGGVISVQVLNEFANVAYRKLGLSWDETAAALVPLRERFTVVPLTEAIHDRGVRIARETRYGLYDSLLLAAALEAGCTTFWSEDLHDGHSVEGLAIRNPFA